MGFLQKDNADRMLRPKIMITDTTNIKGNDLQRGESGHSDDSDSIVSDRASASTSAARIVINHRDGATGSADNKLQVLVDSE